jgi:hypothetical protein
MNIKSRIENLASEIKSLDEQSSELQAKSYNLRQEREQLIAQFILDEKLLDGTDWELTLNSNNSVVLSYTSKNSKSMTDITELARTDYHSWFELSSGIRLQFDDGAVSLNFSEPKQVLPFVKKNRLNVDGSGVSDRLSKLKRDVAALESICHQFGSIL